MRSKSRRACATRFDASMRTAGTCDVEHFNKGAVAIDICEAGCPCVAADAGT